jgi:MATE family multidrug resistance protein
MTSTGFARSGAGERWNAQVWRLAGPIILANLSTPLLGAVDTAVVGHLPDAAYIGGVAIGALIFSFIYWGFGFLRMGTTGFTAQAFGAGDKDELRASLARPALLALFLGAAVILLQWPVGALAFWAVEASPAVENHTALYFEIRIWSAPATLLNFAILGWLLGLKRPGLALLLQLVLNGLNIVLDLVFVIGFGWAIAGVAFATLISEVATAAIGLVLAAFMLRRIGGAWNWRRIRRREKLIRLLRVNFDIFVRTLCLVFAFAVFTAEGAKLGDTTLAANAILMHLLTFAAYGLDGFAHAAEILVGAAVGARDRGKFRAAVRAATVWAAMLACIMTGIYWIAGPSIIALFSNLEDVLAEARRYLPWSVALPIISVWSFQLDGIFIGATRSAALRNAMVLSLSAFLVACWTLVPTLGNHGLWLSMAVFMLARAITLGAYYPALERSVGPAS